MKDKINWPTKRHENFGKFITDLCNQNSVGLVLKGSIARGTSGTFSDIDILIYGNISKDILDKILFGYDYPLMINSSEKPPGLLIIAYQRALALDLEIKKNARIDESDESIILVESFIANGRNYSEDLEEYLDKIARKDKNSKIQKLIHKGLMKYLNGDEQESIEFIAEISEFAGIDIEKSLKTIDSFRYLIKAFKIKDHRIKTEFDWLLATAEEKLKRK